MVSSVISAAMAVAFTLGGVPVQLSGATSNLPMQPPVDHPEVVWSTSQIMPATSILMQDNTRWVVKTKQQLSGGTRVILIPPNSPQTQLGVLVPLDAVNTPIWWVGEVIESPPPEDPGTTDPTNPDGETPGDPDTPPTDPDTPPPPPENP